MVPLNTRMGTVGFEGEQDANWDVYITDQEGEAVNRDVCIGRLWEGGRGKIG